MRSDQVANASWSLAGSRRLQNVEAKAVLPDQTLPGRGNEPEAGMQASGTPSARTSLFDPAWRNVTIGSVALCSMVAFEAIGVATGMPVEWASR